MVKKEETVEVEDTAIIDGYYRKSSNCYICKVRNGDSLISDEDDNFLHLFECEYTLPRPTEAELCMLASKIKEADIPDAVVLLFLAKHFGTLYKTLDTQSS